MDLLISKVAIITGSRRGIGKAISSRFHEEGAKIIAVDILQANLDEHTNVQSNNHAAIESVQADVTDSNDIDRLVSHVVKKYGHIDILVNNAGIGGSKNCLQTTEEEWDQMLSVNLKAAFLFCKRVIPQMITKGGGKIINISSMYGLRGSPNAPAYCASKAGLINLTKQLAVDFSQHNILVNAISPGLIATDMTKHKIDNSTQVQAFLKEIPTGRYGKPSDIAGAALFLASSDANFISGHNLVVDGGQHCRLV